MRVGWGALAIIVMAAMLSCGRGRRGALAPPPDEGLAEGLAEFVRYRLESAHTDNILVPRGWRTARIDGVVVEARHLRPEEAAWNRWPDGTARLFNDRAGWLVEVRAQGDHALRWLPDGTHLELNKPGRPLRAARSPDALLRPLLAAAYEQERSFLDGDLMDRTRAAGPFRAAYVPLAERPGELSGIIAFPVEDDLPVVAALRFTLALSVDGRPRTAAIVWE